MRSEDELDKLVSSPSWQRISGAFPHQIKSQTSSRTHSFRQSGLESFHPSSIYLSSQKPRYLSRSPAPFSDLVSDQDFVDPTPSHQAQLPRIYLPLTARRRQRTWSLHRLTSSRKHKHSMNPILLQPQHTRSEVCLPQLQNPKPVPFFHQPSLSEVILTHHPQPSQDFSRHQFQFSQRLDTGLSDPHHRIPRGHSRSTNGFVRFHLPSSDRLSNQRHSFINRLPIHDRRSSLFGDRWYHPISSSETLNENSSSPTSTSNSSSLPNPSEDRLGIELSSLRVTSVEWFFFKKNLLVFLFFLKKKIIIKGHGLKKNKSRN